VFTTLLLGAFMDIVGLRIGVILMTATLALGQTIVAAGAHAGSFPVILVGRVIAGVSAESLMTAQTAMVCVWFSGQELALAVGIAITLPELGDAMNSFMTPSIMQASDSIALCCWVGVVICIASLVFAVFVVIIDVRADNYDDLHGITGGEGEVVEESLKLEDLKNLSLGFWLLIGNLSMTLGAYIPFMDNANSYFQKRFCFTNIAAGRATMISYLTAIVLSLPFGIIIDATGLRRRWILLDCLVLMSAHVFMWVYPNCGGESSYPAVIGLFLMGVAYSLYATAMLPCPSKLVREQALGTAYGIEAMVSSLSMGVFPLFSSLIQDSQEHDEQKGSRYSALFFTLVSLVNTLFAVSLFYFDRYNTDLLDLKE
jgi:nitrate/nitrite transporter NarK